jgi:hypothetical protein
MKCSDRNQLENISSFIDFVALLIELHIWRNDIKYSSFQDASIDIKISPFEWSLELHILQKHFLNKIIVYYIMRSKNEVLCAAAGRLAAERSEADKPAKAHKTIFAPNNVYLLFFLQTVIASYLRHVKKPGRNFK